MHNNIKKYKTNYKDKNLNVAKIKITQISGKIFYYIKFFILRCRGYKSDLQIQSNPY